MTLPTEALGAFYPVVAQYASQDFGRADMPEAYLSALREINPEITSEHAFTLYLLFRQLTASPEKAA